MPAQAVVAVAVDTPDAAARQRRAADLAPRQGRRLPAVRRPPRYDGRGSPRPTPTGSRGSRPGRPTCSPTTPPRAARPTTTRSWSSRAAAGGQRGVGRRCPRPAPAGCSSGPAADTVDGNHHRADLLDLDLRVRQRHQLGRRAYLYAGSDTTTWILRSLLRFDLKDVPAKATITKADLTLSYLATTTPTPGMRAHRMNQRWTEGPSPSAPCGAGTGASWKEASPGMRWRTQTGGTTGGVYDATGIAPSRRHALAGHGRDGRFQPQDDGPAVGQRQPQQRAAAQAGHREPHRRLPGDLLLRRRRDRQRSVRCWTSPGPTPARTSASRPRSTPPARCPAARVSGRPRRSRPTPPSPAAAPASPSRSTVRRSAPTPPAPYAVSWNSATVASAQHTLTTVGDRRRAGVTESSSSTFTVDNSPPPTGVAITSPAEGADGLGQRVARQGHRDRRPLRRQGRAAGRRLRRRHRQRRALRPDLEHPRPAEPGLQRRARAQGRGGRQQRPDHRVRVRNVTVSNNVVSGAAGPFKACFFLNEVGSSNHTAFVLPPMIETDRTFTTSTTRGRRHAVRHGHDRHQDRHAQHYPVLRHLLRRRQRRRREPSGGRTRRATARADQAIADRDGPAVRRPGVAVRLQARRRRDERVDGRRGRATPRAPGSSSGTAGTPTTASCSSRARAPTTSRPPSSPGRPSSSRSRSSRRRCSTAPSAAGCTCASTSSTARTASGSRQGGNAPVDNPVIVDKQLSENLGLERFWQYEQVATGAGSNAYVNADNGNLLWRWSPWATPGPWHRLDRRPDLQLPGGALRLARRRERLAQHLRPACASARASTSTPTRPTRAPARTPATCGSSTVTAPCTSSPARVNASGVVVWTEPAGVNLYLRSYPEHHRRAEVLGPDAPRQPDLLVRRRRLPAPGRGHQRQHRCEFLLQDTPPGQDPGGPKKRVSRIVDPGGRAYVVDYYDKDEVKGGRVRGNVAVHQGPLGLAAALRLLRRRQPDARDAAGRHHRRRASRSPTAPSSSPTPPRTATHRRWRPRPSGSTRRRRSPSR